MTQPTDTGDRRITQDRPGAASAGRTSRQYLAFVRHERLPSWIIRAVTPVVGGNLGGGERQLRAEQAERDHRRLGAGHPDRIWPWAYAAGGTPIARSIRAGDVLWVFGKMNALGREWPTSLVARMAITETHCGPPGWEIWKQHRGEGTHPGFPFADAYRFYADPADSRFFPYNNAVPQMLDLCFGGSKEPRCLAAPDEADPRTVDGALEAWNQASTNERGRTRFRTIRRLHTSSTGRLEAYAESLERHSVFVSYRWADHDENTAAGREAIARLRKLVECLVENELGVWLDRLILPESQLKERQGDEVLTKILGDGIERSPLLLAAVTANYGGPSPSVGAGTSCAVQPGYTAIEWERAQCTERVRWDLEASKFQCRLTGDVSARLPSALSPQDVALAVRGLLT